MLKPYNKAELTFHLADEIGNEGTNSRVFRAHDPQLNAELVIKQIPKQSFSDRTEFYQEAGILHHSGHPHVVPIHYACEDADFVYLAMPYYVRGSLNQLLNTRFLTVREIIKFSSQFLSGLHNIHSKKLIHFDIKPDNILISNQGEALVSDFGLSKPVELNGLAGQDRVYLKMKPPETYVTEDFCIGFDIYQTGLTLYRMCVGNQEFYRQFASYGGQANFNREQFKFDVRNGRFPIRDDFPEHIPQALITVIKKCLEVEPNNRYKSVIDVINQIAEIDEELLDWQYSLSNEGVRTWEKDGGPGEKLIRLTVDNHRNAIAQKRTARGMQNINEYCVESINRAKIKEFLRRF